jgi:hypothetical protein
MAKKRTRATVNASTSRVMTIDELADKIPNFPRAKGGELKFNTVKAYIDIMRIIARDLDGGDNVIAMLEDFAKVDDYLAGKKNKQGEKLAVNSLKKYYSALNISAKVADITPEAKEFYQTKLFNYMVRSESDRKENYIPSKFGDKLPKWQELSTLPAKFEGDAKFSLAHMIVSLYTMTPPRRLDYFTVKYLSKKPSRRPQVRPPQSNDDVDDNKVPYNYIYKEKSGLYRVVLGNYKTVDNYGIFDNTYSKELSAVIDGYIEKAKIRNGMYLLINTKRKKHGRSGDQSNAVKDAFASVYKDHVITLDNIRHIWTTSLHDNEFTVDIEGQDLTYREMTSIQKEELARLVGHSVIMSENYRQIKARPQKKGKKHTAPAEPVEPEAEAQPETLDIETVEPQRAESVPMDTANIDKAKLIKTMEEYYALKIKLIKKQLDFFDA